MSQDDSDNEIWASTEFLLIQKNQLNDLQGNLERYCIVLDCAPGTQTHIVDIDNRFCREIEKSFCAGKVYPNTFYLDNTRPQ